MRINRTTKTIRTLLILMMAIALAFAFVGCGKDKNKSSEDASSTAATTQAVATEEADDANATEEAQAEWEDPQAESEDPQAEWDDESGDDYSLDEDGYYTDRDDVALYIHIYGHLPGNYITKREAQDMGWQGGNPTKACNGKSIGGDRFGNREGILPKGESYFECDVNYPRNSRGGERLVYTKGGTVYYTSDHYESFQLLYQ